MSLHWGFCPWWCWTIDRGSWPHIRYMSEAMVSFPSEMMIRSWGNTLQGNANFPGFALFTKCEIKWVFKNTHTHTHTHNKLIEYFLWAKCRVGYSYFWYISELPLEWDTNRFLGFTPQKIWFWGLNQAPYPMFLIGTLRWGWYNWLGTGWQAQLEDTSQVLMCIWIT